MSLFDMFEDSSQNVNNYDNFPDIPEFEKSDLLSMEKEMLGIYLSGHPLEDYATDLSKISTIKSIDLIADTEEGLEGMDKTFASGVKDGMQIVIGGIITAVKKKVTKNNSLMAFASVEDLYGTAELLVFPKIYEKYSGLLREETIVIIKGRLSIREDDSPKILPDEIYLPEEYKAKNNMKEIIFKIPKSKAQSLISFAKFFTGKTPVKFVESNSDKEIWTGFMNTSKQVLIEMEELLNEN